MFFTYYAYFTFHVNFNAILKFEFGIQFHFLFKPLPIHILHLDSTKTHSESEYMIILNALQPDKGVVAAICPEINFQIVDSWV